MIGNNDDKRQRCAKERLEFGGLYFHDLRHTFSTRVCRFTDAFTVRDLMGHAKVAATDIYVTTALDEQRRAVEALCNVWEFHQAFTAQKKKG